MLELYSDRGCTGATTYSTQMRSCSPAANGAVVTAVCAAYTPTVTPSRKPTGPSLQPTIKPRHQNPVQAYTTGYVLVTSYSDTSCTSVSTVAVVKLGKCVVPPFAASPTIYRRYQSADDGEVVYSVNYYSDSLCSTLADVAVIPAAASCAARISFSYSTSKPTLPAVEGVAQL